MLEPRRHNPPPRGPVLERPRDARNGQVVALGRAAREDDFGRIRPDKARDLFPRLINRLFRPCAGGMGARGVRVEFRKEGEHELEDEGVARGCRVMVEVDGSPALQSVHPALELCTSSHTGLMTKTGSLLLEQVGEVG